MKNTLEHIYTPVMCGGIGAAPTLIRYNRKYYILDWNLEASPIIRNKVDELFKRKPKQGKRHYLWIKYNRKVPILSPKEILKLVGLSND